MLTEIKIISGVAALMLALLSLALGAELYQNTLVLQAIEMGVDPLIASKLFD